jgi:hypothetical protein
VPVGQAQRDLEFLRCQVVEGGLIAPPRGLAGGGKLGAGHLRPRGRAEAVEHRHGGAKVFAGTDPLPLPPQPRAVGEVRAGGLEGVRRLAVQFEREVEVAVGLALAREHPAAARGPGPRPGLRLGVGVAGEFLRDIDSLRGAAQTQVDLGEFGRGRQVGVQDGAGAERGALVLEARERRLRPAKAQLQLAEGAGRPYLAYAQAQLPGNCQRLGGVRAALLFPALPGLEPREERQVRREVGVLAGFPGQGDRLVETGLRFGPPVRRRLIDRHVAEYEGQHADRGLAARGVERAVGEGPAGVRLAQPDRAHGRPGEQARIVAQFVGPLEHVDRGTHLGRTRLVLAREDQRHAPRDQREERDAAIRIRRGDRGGLFGGPPHGRGVAGVERGVGRFRQHHDGAFLIG